jgi:diguanylate cyclase (GGDEF)-like protein
MRTNILNLPFPITLVGAYDNLVRALLALSILLILLSAGLITYLVVSKKRDKEQVSKDAEWYVDHDSLTGLYSSNGIEKKYDYLRRKHKIVDYVVIRVDISNYKAYELSYGYEAAKEILLVFSRGLKKVFRENTFAGKLEAEHFIVLVKKGQYEFENIHKEMNAHIAEYRHDFPLEMIYGIYDLSNQEVDFETASNFANIALNDCKEKRVVSSTFSQSMMDKVHLEKELIDAFDEAIATRQFKIYFQPIYSLTDGKIHSAEVLVRWQHPKYGLLYPGKFIPLFERVGLINRLDMYVRKEAARRLNDMINLKGLEKTPPISLNISRNDVNNPTLIDYIKKLKITYQIPKNYMNFEITESAYLKDSEKLCSVVKELKSLGSLIYLDDFGNGYSTISSLRDLPVSVIKVDLGFLADNDNYEKSRNILSSIVRMSRWLGTDIVIEGVETKDQLAFIESIGCEYCQGKYFTMPIPEASFDALLENSSIIPMASYSTSKNYDEMKSTWIYDTTFSSIFDNYLGAAAIAEYKGESVEILRVNKQLASFFKLKLCDFKIYYSEVERYIAEEYRDIFIESIKMAIDTQDEIALTITLDKSAPSVYAGKLRVDIKLISSKNESHLLFIRFEKIDDLLNLPSENKGDDYSTKKLFSSIDVGYIEYRYKNNRRVITYVNEWLLKKLGYTRKAFKDKFDDDFFEMFDPDTKRLIHRNIKSVLLKENTHEMFEASIIRAYGDTLRFRVYESFDEIGEDSLKAKAIFIDISKGKEKFAKLESEVSIDYLTGILNRSSLERNINASLILPHDDSKYVALMFDIDNFKNINDSLGHPIGDLVLKAIAKNVNVTIMNQVIFGRLGGDEFLIFGTRRKSDVSSVHGFIDKINETIENLQSSLAIPYKVTVSRGIYYPKAEDYEFNDIFPQVDKAMYEAKRRKLKMYTYADDKEAG